MGNRKWKHMRWGAAALVALAVLAGCKRNETGQLPGASGEAIQAKRDEVKGFALVRVWPDQKGGDGLSLAVEFSQPLVGTQDFDGTCPPALQNSAMKPKTCV
ncbi:MAG: hypothetical protein J0H05_11190 [Stenotrophomonas acidaminiphila]|nr:hypothetical protein [Stenotrophomonas acidaminiphila]